MLLPAANDADEQEENNAQGLDDGTDLEAIDAEPDSDIGLGDAFPVRSTSPSLLADEAPLDDDSQSSPLKRIDIPAEALTLHR